MVEAAEYSLISGQSGKGCVILGSQWGDEGKGKIVDILSETADLCIRFNGGSNAGHTVVVGEKHYAFHLLPSGVLWPNCRNVLGNGVVVHLPTMFKEMQEMKDADVDLKGRIIISNRAQMVIGAHQEADIFIEQLKGDKFIGTTKKGIGPTYSTKCLRIGLRIGDMVNWEMFVDKYNRLIKEMSRVYGLKNYDSEKELEELKIYQTQMLEWNMIQDTALLISKARTENKRILFEAANAVMLDIDFGTYPYVTSSNTTIGGVLTGAGVPPRAIDSTIGVVKAYCTRVGGGPFPSELLDEMGDYLQKTGHEVGVTTGRKRRCGWLDLPQVIFANMLNDYSSICLTKLDVLDQVDVIKVAVGYYIDGLQIDYMPSSLEELAKVNCHYQEFPGWKTDITKLKTYEELPSKAKDYINFLEEKLKCPITWIGNGPGRSDMIIKK